MGIYATNADVSIRLPSPVSASTKPSSTDVDAWIAEAEAELEAELIAQKFTVPVTDTRGVAVVKSKVVGYATARYYQRISGGTDLENANLAVLEMQSYSDFIRQIRADQSLVGAMLGKPQTGSNQGVFRSHVTDNSAGKSVTDFTSRTSMDDEY